MQFNRRGRFEGGKKWISTRWNISHIYTYLGSSNWTKVDNASRWILNRERKASLIKFQQKRESVEHVEVVVSNSLKFEIFE